MSNHIAFSEDDLNSFHDAELSSLIINRKEQTIDIFYTKIDGSKAGFEFKGVSAFRTSGLVLQNVVSRILISSVNDIVDRDIERMATWACSVDNGKLLVESATVTKFIDQIADNDLNLFYVDSSWGAEVAILCKMLSPHPAKT